MPPTNYSQIKKRQKIDLANEGETEGKTLTCAFRLQIFDDFFKRLLPTLPSSFECAKDARHTHTHTAIEVESDEADFSKEAKQHFRPRHEDITTYVGGRGAYVRPPSYRPSSRRILIVSLPTNELSLAAKKNF